MELASCPLSRTFRWLLDFWKIVTPLLYTHWLIYINTHKYSTYKHSTHSKDTQNEATWPTTYAPSVTGRPWLGYSHIFCPDGSVPITLLHIFYVPVKGNTWPCGCSCYLIITGTTFHNLTSRTGSGSWDWDCFQWRYRSGTDHRSLQYYHSSTNVRFTSGLWATATTLPYCNTAASADTKLWNSTSRWRITSTIIW